MRGQEQLKPGDQHPGCAEGGTFRLEFKEQLRGDYLEFATLATLLRCCGCEVARGGEFPGRGQTLVYMCSQQFDGLDDPPLRPEVCPHCPMGRNHYLKEARVPEDLRAEEPFADDAHIVTAVLCLHCARVIWTDRPKLDSHEELGALKRTVVSDAATLSG
ncbi:MAG: hypothetical protein WAZ14_00145 [Patescibacteria group bacterium]